jgi:predicted transcriptional regulator
MARPGPDRDLDEDEILKFINQSFGPAVGTKDVADKFDVTGEGARKYLKRLRDGGYLENRKVGRAQIWWLTTKGEQRVDPGYSDSQ